ncbi:MAG: hypothetical protein P1V19_16755, partial [Gimesia sp.]|nr:hypothetical protein [Gimesia sp.]
MKFFLAMLVWLFLPFTGNAAEEVLYQSDFERDHINSTPQNWSVFLPKTAPDVKVVKQGSEESMHCLMGKRSRSAGLTAIAHRFAKPQQRIMVELTFAFSSGAGRSLNLWSFEPSGSDASQLNLCIQNGALQQYDGRTRSWRIISKKVKPSSDRDHPVWHRLRIVVDARQPGIDFWLSKPGKLAL